MRVAVQQTQDILGLIGEDEVIEGRPAPVSSIEYRSGEIVPGSAFFCIPGLKHDGHDFVEAAVAAGAKVLVVERPVSGYPGVTQVLVRDTRRALALAASAFYGHPSAEMNVIGVTGTNGKTTTTYLVDSIMRYAAHTTGLIGTVETRMHGESTGSERTTPESADLQRLFATMRDAGVDTVSMEVSSHAIDLKRVDGVRFGVAAFTNLTQDHLDYHHTVEEYASVKKRLFHEFDVGHRVVNIDDPVGEQLAAELPEVLTVGMNDRAHVSATDIKLSTEGARFTLLTPDGSAAVVLPLSGAFNVSNALVAAGCAVACGISIGDIAIGLASAPQVPGRLERIDEGQPFAVYVDYAHTPDSLDKAIRAVRHVTSRRVLVVFGCGGDRDPEKRPLMGAAASQGADHIIVTSDNPRSEDPVGIMLQIEDGLRHGPASYEMVVDRRQAIASAFAQAEEGDTVLVAGKGHEDYQIFADRTIHFDDREVAREELGSLC